MAMFSTSSVNVIGFDPNRNTDQARAYAAKYCSKPEKYFYLETTNKDETQNALKKWLQCRTVGLPTAWNRLLNFHTVRSTKAVVYTAPTFVQEPGNCSLRFAEHILAHPDYPEPMNYLTYNGKYFFRNARLRHLRLEQFNRYCIIMDKSISTTNLTSENTIDDDDSVNPYRVLDADHRNFDPTMEGTAVGTIFPPSAAGVPSARRRNDERLGVSRGPPF